MQEISAISNDFSASWNGVEQKYLLEQMHRHNNNYEDESKKDFSNRVSLVPKGYSPRVHSIIQEAKRVFDGTSGPALEQLNLTPLREKLANIRPEDVAGDRMNMLSRGEVGYVSLEDNPNFTIGVFFLAPGATIPLHDHPEMCVLSHVVKGNVHVTSFDFDLGSTSDVAYLVDDGLYSAPVTRTLFPTSGGNLHTFTSRTGCIIVDVMSPPYDEMDGRECTYFKTAKLQGQIYKIEKTIPPEDFEVIDLS